MLPPPRDELVPDECIDPPPDEKPPADERIDELLDERTIELLVVRIEVLGLFTKGVETERVVVDTFVFLFTVELVRTEGDTTLSERLVVGATVVERDGTLLVRVVTVVCRVAVLLTVACRVVVREFVPSTLVATPRPAAVMRSFVRTLALPKVRASALREEIRVVPTVVLRVPTLRIVATRALSISRALE